MDIASPLGVILAVVLCVLWFLHVPWLGVVLSLATPVAAFACVGGAWYRRRRALATVRASSPPEGEQTLIDPQVTTLGGSVEYEAGRDVAMRVEIEQEGREYRSWGDWHHSWTEVRRTVTAVPFVLVTDAGERVRVVPDESTLLRQTFTYPEVKMEATLPPRRVRIATLDEGKRVIVTGRLDGDTHGDLAPSADYRASALPEGWTMRALVVTSEPLVAHQRSRPATHGRHALLYAALGLLSLWTPLAWADRALGTTEEGRVLGVTAYHGRCSGRYGTYPCTSYTTRVETPSGIYAEGQHHSVSAGQRVVVRRGRLSSNLGEQAAHTKDERFCGLMMSLALLMTHCFLTWTEKDPRPWYSQPGKKFTETFRSRLR